MNNSILETIFIENPTIKVDTLRCLTRQKKYKK